MRRTRSPHTRYGPVDDAPDQPRSAGKTGKPRSSIASAAASRKSSPSASAEERPSALDEPRSTRRDKFSKELIADAAETFSRRLGRSVSEDEVRALLGDLADYYTLAGDQLQATGKTSTNSDRREK